jgi:PAS domain S-box-containing protein
VAAGRRRARLQPLLVLQRLRFEKLHVASEAVNYELGEGLPGLAWAKDQPLLLEDIRDTGRFDRAIAAQRAGEPGRLGRIARVAEELGPLVERRRANEALAASQERFQAVTEAAADAIVSADSSGRLLTWNGGAERMFGWTAAEVVGRPLTVIIPERFRQLHTDGIARVRRTGASRLVGQVVELSGLRRDGSEFPVELSIGSWDGPDRSATTAAASRASTASACSASSSAWRAPPPAPGRAWGWPSAARSSRSWGAASASRATTGPTSGSSCRRRSGPAGRPTS